MTTRKYPALLTLLWLTCLLTGCITITDDKICFFCHGHDEVKDAQPIPPFEVPKEEEGTAYLHFLAVGDTGTGGDGQRLVAEAMAAKSSEVDAKFVLLLGDNFYGSGVESTTDPQWEDKFHEVYSAPSLDIPFYAVLGNHDHRDDPDAQVAYARCCGNQRWIMPSRYYTFTHQIEGGTSIQFFALDTYPISSEADEAAAQVKWLDEALAKSTATWKIVYGHHPLYSNGWHGDDQDMIDGLRPILEKHQVDVFLAGHDHDQQLLKSVGGVSYIVSGAGAKSRSVRWADNTVYAATNFGFSAFTVSKDKMVVEFINGIGELEFAHVYRADGEKSGRGQVMR